MKQFAKEFFAKNVELTLRKNADYSGNRGPWSTFEAVTQYGIHPVDGFITRMSDKIQRIETLLTQKAEVKNESIIDTLADLANYCMLLAGYMGEENNLKEFAELFYEDALALVVEESHQLSLFSYTSQDIIREHLKNVVRCISSNNDCRYSLLKIAYYSCLIAYEQNNRVNRTQQRRNQMEKPGNNMG